MLMPVKSGSMQYIRIHVIHINDQYMLTLSTDSIVFTLGPWNAFNAQRDEEVRSAVEVTTIRC